jgi:hypothetical protein
MGLLSQRVIPGAAHDSSARSPPPRCHPETRVKLIARMTAWFHGQAQEELVLWITGPAGVGKSAVVQTFAEYLIKLEFLGASVFFSRPNKRDNPHGVFITIAYQLATRIEAYRNFVVEQLSRDPELLSGDMEAQFRTFIVEPFAGQKIGVGGKRWAILLDGLDELKGEDAQCDIIRLITTFVNDHPDAPLVWIIASRPEAHISDTFDEDDVRRSCWSEHIPIDSTEACADVDHFFRSGFEAIRKKFRRSVPRDWPSNTDFLKLTAAALGLFVYAEVVMQFIRDPEYGDPVSRFKVLVSIIDRSNATPTKENPFVHLDTLYHEILSSIPSDHWSTIKQLFLCTINWTSVAFKTHRYDLERLRTLRGMSILFGIRRHDIYTCLIKCQSVLKLPEWKVAHKSNFVLLHASFADYLSDSARSGRFYVGNKEDALEDMSMNVLATLKKCSRDVNGTGAYGIPAFVAYVDIVSAFAPVETVWHKYCSQLDDERPSRDITQYHAYALRDIASFFATEMPRMSTRGVESSVYVQLLDIHMIRLSYYFDEQGVLGLVRDLMVKYFQSPHSNLVLEHCHRMTKWKL